MIGESPVWGGAMLGAAAGAPGGPVPAFLGLLGGAGAGAIYRQLAGAEQLPKTPGAFLRDIVPGAARDVAWEAGGGLAGHALRRGGQAIAHRLRTPGTGPEPAGLRGTVSISPEAQRGIDERYAEAARMNQRTGIPYGRTPGELLDDPRVRDVERTTVLQPETGRLVRSALNQRALDAEALGEQLGKSLSPRRVSANTGYSQLPAAAKQAVDALYSARKARADTGYDAVLDTMPPVDSRPLQRSLEGAIATAADDSRVALQRALDELKDVAPASGEVPARFLHNWLVGRSFRANQVKGSPTQAALLEHVVTPTRNLLSRTSSDYANAGAQYARDSDYANVGAQYARDSDKIRRVEGTQFGQMARLDPLQYYDAGRSMFRDATSPEDIRRMRRHLRIEMQRMHDTPEAAQAAFDRVWGGFKSAVVQDRVARIKPLQSAESPNVPGKLYQDLGGAEGQAGGRQRTAQMRALLSPREYDRYQELMRAFQETSAIFSYGSPTQGRMRAEAAGGDLIEQAGVELATGGQQSALNTIIRYVPDLVQRWRRGGADVEQMHAEAIVQGLDASMEHLRRLNRELVRARLRPVSEAEEAVARAWGVALGSAGQD